MNVKDKVVIVTGGANGIGRALCRRFAAEGARGVVVADIDADGARTVADSIGGIAVTADVSKEEENVRLAATATAAFGQTDLFCANAGITGDAGVRAKEIDLSKHCGCCGYQANVVFLCRDIGRHRDSTD